MSSPADVDTKVRTHEERMSGKYAILMETNGEECESWYYFIKHDDNEENLKHLQNQLESVKWKITDDLSTFDLELDYLVCAQTAKEMTKVDLNSHSFHRKFDGRLDKIDFKFKKKDSNDTKICKVFDQLGYGQIEDYVSDEDIDEEDLVSNSESSTSCSCSDCEGKDGDDKEKKHHRQKVRDSSSDEESREEVEASDESKANEEGVAVAPSSIIPPSRKSKG